MVRALLLSGGLFAVVIAVSYLNERADNRKVINNQPMRYQTRPLKPEHQAALEAQRQAIVHKLRARYQLTEPIEQPDQAQYVMVDESVLEPSLSHQMQARKRQREDGTLTSQGPDLGWQNTHGYHQIGAPAYLGEQGVRRGLDHVQKQDERGSGTQRKVVIDEILCLFNALLDGPF